MWTGPVKDRSESAGRRCAAQAPSAPQWGNAAGGESVDRPDFAHLGDMVAEVLFDPHFQGHQRGGAADTGPVQADLDDAIVGDIDEFEVAAVGLNRGAYGLDDTLNALMQGGASVRLVAGGGISGRFAVDGRSHEES